MTETGAKESDVYLDGGDYVLVVVAVDDRVIRSTDNGDAVEVLGLLIDVDDARSEQTEALPAAPEQHHRH